MSRSLKDYIVPAIWVAGLATAALIPRRSEGDLEVAVDTVELSYTRYDNPYSDPNPGVLIDENRYVALSD